MWDDQAGRGLMRGDQTTKLKAAWGYQARGGEQLRATTPAGGTVRDNQAGGWGGAVGGDYA